MNLREEQERVRKAVSNSLSHVREDPWLTQRVLANVKGEASVKRKCSVSAILVFVLLAVSVTAALAVGWISIIGERYNLNDRAERQQLFRNIQRINDSYEGNAVRCVLTEALYDSAAGSYGLGWTLEPLQDGDRLYVVLDGITIGGEYTHTRGGINGSEYLMDQKTDNMVIGELPENGRGDCEIAISVLRPIGEIVRVHELEGEAFADTVKRYREMLANGQLPMEGDGWIYCYHGETDLDQSYSDQLLQTGLMEIADRFTLKLDISKIEVSEIRTYTGRDSFVYDGYEIRIRNCLVTPFTAKLELEYITDTRPGNDGKGKGPMLNLQLEVPGAEIWSLNQCAIAKDPVQLADGRWSTLFTVDAQELQVFPEAFIIRVGFDLDGHTFVAYDDIITLKLTDDRPRGGLFIFFALSA